MNNKAFTLIELVVGITISMLLMVSVGIFVNNGMANILIQQKVIKNTSELTDFTSNIHTVINLIQSGSVFPVKTASGILFKRGQNLGEGGFSYIGTITSTADSNGDGIYCESGSKTINTKHIILKNFIPFEEQGEDIFNDYTGSLISNISTTSPTNVYRSFQKENKISIKKPGKRKTIIGKGIFGNKFKEGALGTDIYLNSPTGLAKIGNNLLISDTLNNRILWYDTTNKTIHKLLDQSDGLNEPTGLYYNDSEKALYIANSGNGEILKYSSKSTSEGTLIMTGITSTNINKIQVQFSGDNNPNLNTKGDWSITNTYSDSYKTNINNKILYYSIEKNSNKSSKPNCTGAGYLFEDGIDNNKPTFYCTKAGTGRTLTYPKKDISEIKISNINTFTETGSYFVNLELYNDDNLKYHKYFPYFIKSDDNILTKDDNILEIIHSGLNYPTGIWGSGINDLNKFGKTSRNFSNLSFSLNKTDTILKTPIEKFNVYIEDDLITLYLKYFKKYNCYNPDDNSKRTYLFKKSLK